jgi:hypothetical protein
MSSALIGQLATMKLALHLNLLKNFSLALLGRSQILPPLLGRGNSRAQLDQLGLRRSSVRKELNQLQKTA